MKCSFCENEAVDSVHVKDKDFDFCYRCQIEAMKGFAMDKEINKTADVDDGELKWV